MGIADPGMRMSMNNTLIRTFHSDFQRVGQPREGRCRKERWKDGYARKSEAMDTVIRRTKIGLSWYRREILDPDSSILFLFSNTRICRKDSKYRGGRLSVYAESGKAVRW